MAKNIIVHAKCENMKCNGTIDVPDLKNEDKQKRYYHIKIFDEDISANNNKRKKEPFAPKKNHSIFKYMNLGTAINCLKNRNIRFVIPTEWPDKYEGRFYNAEVTFRPDNPTLFPKPVYCCCFTTNKASEASWKTYSDEKTGLGTRVVQFEIDLNKFRNELSLNVPDCYSIYEGPVCYRLNNFEIENLHRFGKNRNKLGNLCIDESLSKESYNWLPLLLLKRPQFYYENEFRFMILSSENSNEKEEFINISWENITKKIIVDDNFSKMEIEILTDYCEQNGIVVKKENNNDGIILKTANLYKMETDKRIKIIDF